MSWRRRSRHIKIFSVESCYFTEDLKAKNGTMINGELLDAGFSQLITEDDRIQLGSTVIHLDRIGVNKPPITVEDIEPHASEISDELGGFVAPKVESLREIHLITGVDNDAQKADIEEKLEMLHESLRMKGIEFKWTFSPAIHDRAVKLDNGWTVKIGRGLDIYQKPENWYSIGTNDFDLRPCLETSVDIYRS